MTNQNHPVILITHKEYARDEIIRQIRQAAPGATIYGPEEYKADPSLIEQIEIILGKPPLDAIASAGKLRWIHTTAAGADWAQKPAVLSHPVQVTNSRIHAEPIAEQLFGMLLALFRGIHQAVRDQSQRYWNKSGAGVPEILTGKTLCVVGLGVIGRRCAELGEVFGMDVIGVRRHAQPTPHVRHVYGSDHLREALAAADVVMVVLPGTAETRGLIGEAEFPAMRKGAYFLNAGRGATVNTDALVSALRSGRLAGAGLDVVDPEPLPVDHPLWEFPNVIITPHTSGKHKGYTNNALQVFLVNLRNYLSGKPLESLVDKPLGY